MTFLFIPIFLSILILSGFGCSFNPTLPSKVKIDLPKQYLEGSPANSSLRTMVAFSRPWWQIFRDPNLDKLINLVLRQNYDLKQAIYDLRILQKQLKLTKSSLYPQLSLQASTGKQANYLSGPTGQKKMVETTPTSVFLLTSYELDFFQKINSQKKANLEAILANQEQLRLLRQTLVSSAVQLYLNLSFLNYQVKVYQRLLELQKQTTKLLGFLYQNGQVTYEQLLTSQNQELQLKNDLLAFKQKGKDVNYQLCLLLGRYPQPITTTPWEHFAKLKLKIRPGLPSQLLKNRPDILAAEKRLKELAFKAKVARRERFPQIRLTSQLGYTSAELESLFSPTSFLYNLAFNLTAPIFDASRLKTKEDLAVLAYAKAEQNYAKTVLLAFKEVETNLSKLKELRLTSINLKQTFNQAQKKLKLITYEYHQGQVPYTLVLEQKKILAQAKLSLEQNQLEQLITQVSLIKSLGGTKQVQLVFK